MSEPEKSDEQKLAEAVLWLVACVAHPFIEGFICMKLWAWFLVPLGAPVIGMAHAAGISLLVSFATMRVRPKEDIGVASYVAHVFVLPPIFLAAGAAIRSFM